ncbi:putative ubiquitinyl hydrolase 1 [Helianthus annuus]|nr:putative ubiquitinyl hydrolase 1 [Helianthus annuus]KAJ0747267.1 putative ubiquitinyl hydrolase 1 [Helianthus annuus]
MFDYSIFIVRKTKSAAAQQTEETVDAPVVIDPPWAARFTWTIENFSKVTAKKLYSDAFFIGGYNWRLLVFPKGNTTDHLSMYLDAADSISLPHGWETYAQFSISVVNRTHSESTIRKGHLMFSHLLAINLYFGG